MRRVTGWLHVIVLGAFGCGDDVPDEVVRKTIGPSGGLVSSHDGVLTLNFLPGQVSEDVTLEVMPSDTPPLVYGPAYRVKPNFDLPFELEVTYRRVLPSDPSHTAVAAIHREDYLAGEGDWVPLRRTELDIENDLVAGLDREVSLFYALVDDADPGTAEGSTTNDDTGSESDTGPEPETGTDSGEETTTEEGESEDTASFPELSHARDIQPIWTANCLTAACHETITPVLADDAYDDIVGVSSFNASAPFVAPGNVERSYLWFKVTDDIAGCGCGGTGSRMPAIGDPLDDDTLAMIRAWIQQGALP